MSIAIKSLLAFALLSGPALPAAAADGDPLFINLTSDEAHRAQMAIGFGSSQHARGHPVTVFLNDKAVKLASKANAKTYAAHQKALGELITKGALVIVCPTCMKHYGIEESDLLPGLQVGNPEKTGAALFKDGTRTLSW